MQLTLKYSEIFLGLPSGRLALPWPAEGETESERGRLAIYQQLVLNIRTHHYCRLCRQVVYVFVCGRHQRVFQTFQGSEN